MLTVRYQFTLFCLCKYSEINECERLGRKLSFEITKNCHESIEILWKETENPSISLYDARILRCYKKTQWRSVCIKKNHESKDKFRRCVENSWKGDANAKKIQGKFIKTREKSMIIQEKSKNTRNIYENVRIIFEKSRKFRKNLRKCEESHEKTIKIHGNSNKLQIRDKNS